MAHDMRNARDAKDELAVINPICLMAKFLDNDNLKFICIMACGACEEKVKSHNDEKR